MAIVKATGKKPKVPVDYQQNYIHCRTFGHTWKIGDNQREGVVYVRFVLLCQMCHTRRIDTINRRTGGVTSRNYEYPDGYQASPGEGLQRVTYRIELIRRVVDDE